MLSVVRFSGLATAYRKLLLLSIGWQAGAIRVAGLVMVTGVQRHQKGSNNANLGF